MRRGDPATVIIGIVALALAAKAINWLVGFVHANATWFIAGAVIAVFVGALALAGRTMASREDAADRLYLAMHIDETDDLTGAEFEHWCADLLQRSGLSDVRIVGASGDRGADTPASLLTAAK